MFGSTSGASIGSGLGRSASFSFSQPPANKPFSGTSGGFSFGGAASNATSTATSTTAQPAAGGFSFGAKPAITTAAPATGGLFGFNTNTQQPGQQPQQQQQQQQQSTGFGTGLFGSSTDNAASTSTSGGLFGKPAAPATGGGFSFGNNASTSTTTGGGLFGTSTQPAQQQQQQQPSTSLFGGFGASQPQQQLQQPQQQNTGFGGFQAQAQNQPAASPFSRFGYFQKERFNDLPDDARKLVEELETHIAAQAQLRDELKTKNFGDEIRKCAAEWHELDSALKSLSATLDTDSHLTTDISTLLESDRRTTSTLYSIIVNAKDAHSPSSSDGSSFVEWLETFFSDLATSYRDRISRYSATVETIQHHLQSLQSRETYTPQAISDAIHAQHESFMSLAAQVAALHAEVDGLKKDYAKWYKQVHKSVRDPFGSMNSLAGSVPPAS